MTFENWALLFASIVLLIVSVIFFYVVYDSRQELKRALDQQDKHLSKIEKELGI